mmetsp:Transcript_25264/g.41030  ORF Transcript_25264/g.41030 Transcript_25264/m.41030 type:complete len:83 (+) Transcript_25264:306-554(+)
MGTEFQHFFPVGAAGREGMPLCPNTLMTSFLLKRWWGRRSEERSWRGKSWASSKGAITSPPAEASPRSHQQLSGGLTEKLES